MMANFTGTFASPLRAKSDVLDTGPVTKRLRGGIERGHNVLPYNVFLRGLTRRVDTTKLP